MTAPAKPLPVCRYCGQAPVASEDIDAKPQYRFARVCVGIFHEACTYGRTQAEADARWRRAAGGK